MNTETREIYKCDHCRKLYQIKTACIAHEPKCRKNPDNHQRCMDGCVFLIMKSIKNYYHDGTHYGTRDILFCKEKNEGVHPYWINGVIQEDMPDEVPNNPMPKKCNLFNGSAEKYFN